jgi:hypothetical protein
MGDGGSHHRAELEALAPQRHFSADGAADVEQVVQDLAEVGALPGNDLLRRSRLLGKRQPLEQVRGHGNGAERVAQLMAEHRQELVLRPAGGLRFLARGVRAFVQAGIAQRERRLCRQAHARALFVVGERLDLAPAGVDDALQFALLEDRHHERAARAFLGEGVAAPHRPDQGVARRIGRAVRLARLHDVSDETAALARADGLVSRARSDQVAIDHLAGDARRQRDAHEVAPRDAPRFLGHGLEHARKLERAAERARHVGQPSRLDPRAGEALRGRAQSGVERFDLANARRCRRRDLPARRRIGRERGALDAASDMASEIPGGENARREQNGQQPAE